MATARFKEGDEVYVRTSYGQVTERNPGTWRKGVVVEVFVTERQSWSRGRLNSQQRISYDVADPNNELRTTRERQNINNICSPEHFEAKIRPAIEAKRERQATHEAEVYERRVLNFTPLVTAIRIMTQDADDETVARKLLDGYEHARNNQNATGHVMHGVSVSANRVDGHAVRGMLGG